LIRIEIGYFYLPVVVERIEVESLRVLRYSTELFEYSVVVVVVEK
jgi:hypothetical protein